MCTPWGINDRKGEGAWNFACLCLAPATAVNGNATDVLDALAERLAGTIAEKLKTEFAGNHGAQFSEEPWRLWSVDDVAERLGRSRRSVFAFVKYKGLPVIKLDDGSLRFDPRDVQKWCEARRIPTAD